MRIILLSGIFPPEPFLAAQTTFSMAKELSALGHEVIVIAPFPSRPGGKFYPGCKNKLFSKEFSPFGFDVVHCLTAPSSKSTFTSRFVENIVFGISSSLYILLMPKVSVIHTNTWPIFATGLLSKVARLRRIPYVIHVDDLYPESMLSQKRLGNDHWMIKLMRNIDKWIARGAKHIIVISDSFAQVYQEDRKVPAEKITVIPNWVDSDLACVDQNESALIRQQFNIGGKEFLAAYGGNIGVGAGVDTLIKASAVIEDVQILIAGGGSELPLCQELADRIAPEKVHFYSPWPSEKTMAVYQSADVLVLTTHNEQSLASIPSKLIRYMLSARPIIAASLPGAELYSLITRSGCGWVIPPDDPDALAHAILEARHAGARELDHRGKAGREYALQNLTGENNLPKVIGIMETKTN